MTRCGCHDPSALVRFGVPHLSSVYTKQNRTDDACIMARTTTIKLLFFLPVFFLGCRSNPPPPPTAQIASATERFDYPAAGITLEYPSDWKPVPGTKSQLKVIAPGGGELSLDVPVLPFHIPGMIPVDSVTSGYIDDVKKRMPDAAVTHLPDPTLPDARQRRVKLVGHQYGMISIDEAVLIVHDDHVYILAIDADDRGYSQMHAKLDAVLNSLRWTTSLGSP